MVALFKLAAAAMAYGHERPEYRGLGTPSFIPVSRRQSLVDDLWYRESPSVYSATKHVVIVMDALMEFSPEPLEWALTHVIRPGYVVTLLGVMPWLNLALSCKTWLGVWNVNFEALKALRETSEWKLNVKYQKVRRIIELCDRYGVVPHMKVAMGHPLKLVVLEQTTYLHATWVVFDRHHRRNRAYYAKRIPCNVVMMNNEGEFDMLTARPMIENGETPLREESPVTLPRQVPITISEDLIKAIRANEERLEKGSAKPSLFYLSWMYHLKR